MKGKEFIDRAAAWARAHGQEWRVEPSRGKGGHKRLYVGARWTIVQSGELPNGTFRDMLKQLDIPKSEF